MLAESLRSLRRSPLFTALTLATLSLGIGATTAVCSFVDGILVILGVALAASLVPATRAVRTPAATLLKSE